MTAESLQRRLTGKGVTVSALHPGMVSGGPWMCIGKHLYVRRYAYNIRICSFLAGNSKLPLRHRLCTEQRGPHYVYICIRNVWNLVYSTQY